MSQENVEVVRLLFEHWTRDDWNWGQELFDDDCEAVFSGSWFPEAAVHRIGHEAVRAWIGFTGAFETFAIEVEQIVDAGEQVIVLAWLQGRGRASGADVNAKTGAIFTFRDAKIVRYALTDRREALEAVGLRE
jgi:ketosteroid isomerase-like protein